MKIVITDCSWGNYDIEKQYLPQDAEVVCKQILTEEEVIETCQGAVATLSEYAPYTRRVLERMGREDMETLIRLWNRLADVMTEERAKENTP